jgi:hypothetical protein
MSGIEQIKTTPCYGPRKPSRLDLMGIRFVVDPNEAGGGGAGGGSEYTPPATQEELDRIIGDRLGRERDKFKDYDAIKDKASKYDAAQAGGGAGSGQNDDVTQRLTSFEERVTAAEKTTTETQNELEATRVRLVRSEVAIDKGIAKDDLILLTATTKEDLEKQADRIVKLNAGSGKIPGQGAGGGSGSGTVAAGRELFDSKHKKTT